MGDVSTELDLREVKPLKVAKQDTVGAATRT